METDGFRLARKHSAIFAASGEVLKVGIESGIASHTWDKNSLSVNGIFFFN